MAPILNTYFFFHFAYHPINIESCYHYYYFYYIFLWRKTWFVWLGLCWKAGMFRKSDLFVVVVVLRICFLLLLLFFFYLCIQIFRWSLQHRLVYILVGWYYTKNNSYSVLPRVKFTLHAMIKYIHNLNMKVLTWHIHLKQVISFMLIVLTGTISPSLVQLSLLPTEKNKFKNIIFLLY